MAVITNFGVPVDGSVTTLMPKLQYRFRVAFTGLGNGSPNKSSVTQNVISTSRPNLTHEEVVIDSYNSKMYLAGKHTWEPITVVFRDDMSSHVIKAIGAQLNKQVDHADQASSISGSAYKFTMQIETLDGNNTTPTVFDSWDLAGCFITQVQYGDLNYADSNMVQVTMTIRFDQAAHMIGGTDALSADNVSSSRNDTGTLSSGVVET
tara:strand:- start:223 stop:843 length:621 start_codon:yes stop_codon:yes gene_type:complete